MTQLSPTAAGPALPTQTQPDPQQKKLEAGAHEFEASMLSEMFKGLHFGQGVGGSTDGSDDEDGGSGSGGTVASFATEALGKAIAGAGGLGIAKQVLAQVSAERLRHEASAAGPAAAASSTAAVHTGLLPKSQALGKDFSNHD